MPPAHGSSHLQPARGRDDAVHVLHIDDSYPDHVFLTHCLKRAPRRCNVVWAQDLEEATSALWGSSFDVVILDLHLTRVRGLETLRKYREIDAPAPVVVLTGLDDRTTAVDAIAAGAEDYVCKDTLDPARLWDTLAFALTRWRRWRGASVTPALPARARVAFAPGEQVDRYVVEGEIELDSPTRVYRVRHVGLDTQHALKVFASESDHEEAAMEGWIQARLRHPNVVRASDLIDLGDHHHGLIMDYVPGPSLAQQLAEGGMSAPWRSAAFRGIVQGVAYAHQHGLVHRDLKPSNVLLEDGSTPRITDFGVAKLLNPTGVSRWRSDSRETRFVGTPGYMAPEQIDDADAVDQRADLFSLGCILYRLVCGRDAFSGESPMATLLANARGAYVDPRVWVPSLSEGLSGVIERLLAVDPNARMPHCDALLTSLHRLAPEA